MGARRSLARRVAVGAGAVLALSACGFSEPAPTVEAPVSGVASARGLGGAALLDRVFTSLDADRSGALSPGELGLSADQFAALDRDGDGQVSRDEFLASTDPATALALFPRFRNLVDAAFSRLDANHDGVVTEAEIQADLGGASGEAVARYRATFAAVDVGRTGRIGRPAFDELYRRLGTGQSAPQAVGAGPLAGWLVGGYAEVMGQVEAQLALHPFPKPPEDTDPGALKMAFTPVAYPTSDGLTIRSWWIPAARPSTRTVILVHGYRSNKASWVREGELGWLHPDYNLLAIDLRNHGISDGTVTTFDHDEYKDVVASVDWLAAHGQTDVAAFGNSLGGATVLHAAAVDHRIKAVWDDCAYGTVLSAWTGFAEATPFPDCPLIAAAALGIADDRVGFAIESTQPVNVVAGISPTPLFIVHGAADVDVIPANSQWNYDAAGQPKFLWFVPGAGHGMSDATDPQDYSQKLLQFLGTYL